jgi:hypothetical protein
MLPRMATLPVLAAVLTACSGGSPVPTADAAAPLTEGGLPPVPVRCDVVAQTCGAGQRCDFTCDNGTLVIGCITAPASPSQVGASCAGSDGGISTGSSCVAGTGCFSAAGKPASCFRYCKAGSDCPAGTTCNTTVRFRAVCPNGAGDLPVGLCL